MLLFLKTEPKAKKASARYICLRRESHYSLFLSHRSESVDRMPPPRSRTGRSISLRDSPTSRFTELEKIEGGGASWDVLEWTKIEVFPSPRVPSLSLSILTIIIHRTSFIQNALIIIGFRFNFFVSVIRSLFRGLFLSECSNFCSKPKK